VPEAAVKLKRSREGAVRRRHPWLFSGSVAETQGSPGPGDTVLVLDSNGKPMGRGAFTPDSALAVRFWTFDPDEKVDRDFFRRRLVRAVAAREPDPEGGRRLVNAESDGLPGLVVDRYARWLAVQFLTTGTEARRDLIVGLLQGLVAPRGIWERSDLEVRAKEGLEQRRGPLAGEEPPELVEIVEGPVRFGVDLRGGHKTGFYLDQRDNRILLGGRARGLDVLNAFSYSGGFGVHALAGDAASVTSIDTSATLLEQLDQNVARNDLDAARVENIQGDVFEELRTFRDSRRDFDLIVLDPPKFAATKSQVQGASRGYKDINLLAFKLLRPGGTLFTFSCSGHVAPDLFQKIVADAALDAERDGQIVGRMTQAPDHPVALPFPEGHYLKGLICRVP